jgi:protocatechuate 3,4-dioxygenase alpha subunit
VRPQTPSQTVGPFFAIGLTRTPRHILASAATPGERIRVEGGVFDRDGTSVADALIEVWQADADGRYRHALDAGGDAADPAFTGFGRAETSADGTFFFETIKPGRVRGHDGAWQAPHLNVIVFARGMLLHAFTRMYFSDDPANTRDGLLSRIDPARRATLIARRAEGGGAAVYRWDVHLQGAQETVFFDA